MKNDIDRLRCSVVCAEAGHLDAAGLVGALTFRGDVDVACVVAGDSATAAAAPDAVVFVAAGFGVEQLAQQIAVVRGANPCTAVLVAGSSLCAEDIIALMGAGAYDYIALPCVPDEMMARLRRALGDVPAQARAAAPQAVGPRIRDLVFASPAFARVAAKLPTLAACDANLLILGETGTGKEVCAQAVHCLSPRAAKPWIAVNCGALPNELVENELFGRVKGGYTNAHTQRAGLVQEAEGGTLFLDDIDCLPLAAQSKLLRFLRQGEYRPVGSNTLLRADVRVIAASNCLSSLALQGRFRQDLYFRLNVLNLMLPPLRERTEDIPVLALHFTHRFARQFSRPVGALTPGALRKLMAHAWPGNVRELQHVIERAVLMSSGPALLADDIEIEFGRADAPAEEGFRIAKARVIDNFERGYLEQLLAAYRGNVTHAARAAKKDRRAFFELMRKHRVVPERFRGVDS